MRAKFEAREVVNSTTAIGGVASVVPVPGTSLVLSIYEAKMVGKVAQIYGLKIEGIMWPILLKAILLQIGGASLLKKIAMEASIMLGPFAFIAKPAIATATIKGIGEAAIAFFEERFPYHKAYEPPEWEQFYNAFKDGFRDGVNGSGDYHDLYHYWSSLF